jgi:hypothetical protein
MLYKGPIIYLSGRGGGHEISYSDKIVSISNLAQFFSVKIYIIHNIGKRREKKGKGGKRREKEGKGGLLRWV